MALNKELWLTTLQEQLFKNDEFLSIVGQDHSAYVNNITVHIPQAGANPTITKNASSFPLLVGSRTDTDLTYSVDLYYAPPIRIGVDETQYISYDKRASVLMSSTKKLRNVIGNNTLYKWAPSGANRIVRTSGSATAKALAPSATGTRKDPTLEDFFNVNALLDQDNLNPADARYAIMPSAMYWALINDPKISKYLEWGSSAVSPTGKVPMVAGITLLKRSSVIVYDNTGTPVIKSVDDEGTPSSPTTSDNLGVIVVSESYVSKAVGNMDIFANDKRADYFGDIISAVVAHGASKMRTDQAGIVALIQTT